MFNIQKSKSKNQKKNGGKTMEKVVKKANENVMKNTEQRLKKVKLKGSKGITLIALVITTIFSYDEKLKSGNNNGFLLETI